MRCSAQQIERCSYPLRKIAYVLAKPLYIAMYTIFGHRSVIFNLVPTRRSLHPEGRKFAAASKHHRLLVALHIPLSHNLLSVQIYSRNAYKPSIFFNLYSRLQLARSWTHGPSTWAMQGPRRKSPFWRMYVVLISNRRAVLEERYLQVKPSIISKILASWCRWLPLYPLKVYICGMIGPVTSYNHTSRDLLNEAVNTVNMKSFCYTLYTLALFLVTVY